jgi:putative nucleotidyltransferase with HDIG domain
VEVRDSENPIRGRRRRLTRRSVTLLQAFLIASAGILIVGALAVGWSLSKSMRSAALQAERTSLTTYIDGAIGPALVRGDRLVATKAVSKALQRALRAQPDVVTVKVWLPNGTLAWTNRDANRIGHRFPLDGELGEAIRTNRAVSGIVGTGGDHAEENAVERSLGYSQLFQIYAPLHGDNSAKPIGAYEVYANPAAVQSLIGSRTQQLWLIVALVFVALYVALTLLVRGASATLRRQTDELRDRSTKLMESYRLLEQSSLEAVESLNATVDAKDAYTAGHSQRVQGIALRIGEELRLDTGQHDALKFAALFHDIGKLRVPDAILSKPSALSAEEYELIKRHPEDGAAIIEHLGRLRDAVSIIRHHHERWDGGGYPNGLAGEAIPPEASVVGLADAWDAMTTERPYSRALSVDEAAGEIRNGKGSQFAPSVVDAFFTALRRAPADFQPEAPATGAVFLTAS